MTAPDDTPPPRTRRGQFRAPALALLAAVFAGGVASPAAAQDHRFRLFAGVGLQFFARPELSPGRGAGLGGTAAYRATDNISVSTGFFFGRSNRRYTAANEPVEDVIAQPAYQFRTNRYHFDGSVTYHFGRRQPFQFYVLAGGGLVRRDERREDFLYETTDPGATTDGGFQIQVPVGNEVTLVHTAYSPTVHAAVGFEVYVFSYLSARAEYRLWSSRDFSFRTQQAMIGVNYYR